MPNIDSLTPDIPENFIVTIGAQAESIKFTLGYDTISCNCGLADCLSFCDSQNGMSARLTN